MQTKRSSFSALAAVFLASANLASSETANPVAPPVTEQETSDWWSIAFTTQYSSKYIFRGVNSLPGSGIYVAELTSSVYDFSFDVWQAVGVRRSYDEVDFTLEWDRQFGPMTFSAGYVNYYIPNDDGLSLGYRDTQEFLVAAAYNIISSLTASLTYNYDFDKLDGSYLELRLDDSFEIIKHLASINPYASLSYDFHYNSKTYALNNLQTGLEMPISLGKHVTISGFAALSIPLHAINGFARNEGWGGFSITFSF
jgi:hypothetical protein